MEKISIKPLPANVVFFRALLVHHDEEGLVDGLLAAGSTAWLLSLWSELRGFLPERRLVILHLEGNFYVYRMPPNEGGENCKT